MAIAPVQPLSTNLAPAEILPVAAVKAVGPGQVMVATEPPAVEDADLGKAAQTPIPTPKATSSAAPADPGPAATAQTVVRTAAEKAVISQSGLAPLMADLEVAAVMTQLPAPARQAIAQVLRMRLPLTPTITAPVVERAFVQSGVLLEAKLAQPTPPPNLPATDMKAALLVLRQALEPLAASAQAASTPAGSLQAAGARPRAPISSSRSNPPPPPYAGGPTSAQQPAAPSLPRDLSVPAVAQRLVEEADAAVARHELMQIASLPETKQTEQSGRSWLFEAPFHTPQGCAVAQFEVHRDGGGGDGASGSARPSWSARFSIDLEAIGGVHAQAVLSGDKTRITLWAERGETARLLRGEAEDLLHSLAAAGLPAEIAVYEGAPRRPTPEAGRFLDQAL